MVMRNKHEAAVRLAVAAYYRMSSDDQSASIAQQQKEVRKYAQQRGWRIVEEYLDEGKSGSKDIEKRVHFHELIAASAKGDFTAVIVYDSSRFARLDTLDAAPYKNVLRSHGVHLESVREGRIDWSTSMGRLQDAMLSEANNDYSKKLAGAVIRGRMHALEQGYWPHGTVPFGFARQFVEGGVVQMTVPRTKLFRKPKNWKLKLIADPTEAKAVKHIFELFAATDISLRSMTRKLANVLSPTGHGWPINSLVSTLKNPVYCGDYAIGSRGTHCRGAFERATPTINRNAVEAIVPRTMWDFVQAKMKRRHALGRRIHSDKAATLSGLMTCGHCGHRLIMHRKPWGVTYSCSSGYLRPHIGCKCWSVRESVILPEVLNALVSAVDFEVLQSAAFNGRKKLPLNGEVDRLKNQIAEMERRIAKGSKNLLLADADVFASLQSELMEWKKELTKLQNTLALVVPERDGDDLKRWVKEWEKIRPTLVPIVHSDQLGLAPIQATIDGKRYELDEDAKGKTIHQAASLPSSTVYAEPEAIRELLMRMNATVTVSWTPNGKRYFAVEKAVLRADFAENSLCLSTNTPARSVKRHSITWPARWRTATRK